MISRFVDRYERNTSTREEILQRVLYEVQAGERASRFGSCVARRLQVPQSSGVGRTSEDEGWRGKEGRRAVAGQRAGHAKIFSFATDTALLTRTGDQPQGDLLRLTAKSIPATPKFFTLTSPFFFFFFKAPTRPPSSSLLSTGISSFLLIRMALSWLDYLWLSFPFSFTVCFVV